MSKKYKRRPAGDEPEVEVRDLWRENRVDRIRRRVCELVEGWTTREVQEVGGARGRRAVVIEHPSLLEQLRGGGMRSTAGSSGGPSSRPPASIEATSLLREIEEDVIGWGEATLPASFLSGLRVGAGSRPRLVVALLEVLARRAHALPVDDLDALDGDVLRWWGRARVVTSWDREPVKLAVECMACAAFGRVQVRLDPLVAVCMECHTTWDEQTIGILGQHVRLATEAAAEVVAIAVEKARGHGRAAPGATSDAATLLAGLGPDRPWPDAPTSADPEPVTGVVV